MSIRSASGGQFRERVNCQGFGLQKKMRRFVWRVAYDPRSELVSGGGRVQVERGEVVVERCVVVSESALEDRPSAAYLSKSGTSFIESVRVLVSFAKSSVVVYHKWFDCVNK
jgi:hypothetical protein